jgi:hypothetical protein
MLKKVLLVLAAAAMTGCSSSARLPGPGMAGNGGGAGHVGGASGSGGLAGGAGGRAGAAGGSAGGAAGAAGGAAGAAGAPADGGVDAGSDADAAPCVPVDDNAALILPQCLDVELEQGGAGTLTLTALTLRDEPDGLAIYASLKNTGTVAACDAALKITLYDKSGQPLGMFINGLYTYSFYLYTTSDGSNTIAACASIGDVTMTKISTMATDIHVADVGKVVYYYAYFDLPGATVIDALKLGPAKAVTADGGTAYAGAVVNDLSTMVSDPSVAVFSVNSVGRPLDLVTASDTSQVAAGASWTYQTASTDMPGVNFVVFPSAAFSN